MIGGKTAAQTRPSALGSLTQSSTYGATIPSIYGLMKSSFLAIWAQNLREGGSGKKWKNKKKGITTYVENIDFLLGQNPILGMMQGWVNATKLPLNFVSYNASVASGYGAASYTISDPYFYAVVAVTGSSAFSETFNDYGSPGPNSVSGTFEIPFWNMAFNGPDPTNGSASRAWPFVYYWDPTDGATVYTPGLAAGAIAPGILINQVNIYYAQLSSALRHVSPAAYLRLTFEPTLADGPEYTGDIAGTSTPLSSQQILMPQYAGCGSADFDLGSSGAIPDTRPEVQGSYGVYSTGDADFADMIEDIVKSGIAQTGIGDTGNSQGPIQHGASAFDFPGCIQKNMAAGVKQIASLPFYRANVAGNILLGMWQGLPGPSVNSVSGSSINQIYCPNEEYVNTINIEAVSGPSGIKVGDCGVVVVYAQSSNVVYNAQVQSITDPYGNTWYCPQTGGPASTNTSVLTGFPCGGVNAIASICTARMATAIPPNTSFSILVTFETGYPGDACVLDAYFMNVTGIALGGSGSNEPAYLNGATAVLGGDSKQFQSNASEPTSNLFYVSIACLEQLGSLETYIVEPPPGYMNIPGFGPTINVATFNNVNSASATDLWTQFANTGWGVVQIGFTVPPPTTTDIPLFSDTAGNNWQVIDSGYDASGGSQWNFSYAYAQAADPGNVVSLTPAPSTGVPQYLCIAELAGVDTFDTSSAANGLVGYLVPTVAVGKPEILVAMQLAPNVLAGTYQSDPRWKSLFNFNSNQVSNMPGFAQIRTVWAPTVPGVQKNLLAWSQNYEQSVWLLNDVATPTPDSVTDPAGGNTAEALVATAGGNPFLQQSINLSALSVGETLTFSVWLKTPVVGGLSVAVGFDASGTAKGVVRPSVTSGWQRFSTTYTIVSGDLASFFAPLVGDGAIIGGSWLSSGQELDVWGAQVEFGSVATSYSPNPNSLVISNNNINGFTRMIVAGFKLMGTATTPNAFGNFIDDSSMQICRTQARAYGLYGSLTMLTQKDCRDWMKDLYSSMNSAPFFSGDVLKQAPYGEQSMCGNGAVYVAPTSTGPIQTLSDLNGDFIGDSKKPVVTISRKAQFDAPNILQYEILNRSTDYNPVVVSQPEPGSIALYGVRKQDPEQHYEIADTSIARILLGIAVRRQNYIRNTAKFVTDVRKVLLEPMDLINLIESKNALNAPFRLTSVSIGANWQIECEAEPYVFGVHAPLPVVAASLSPNTPTAMNDPGNVNTPIIFEPVPRLYGSTAQAQLWAVISGSSPDYAGCIAYVSIDGGSSYQAVTNLATGGTSAAVNGNGITGYTTADWPSADDPDTTNNLAVNLTESLGSLVAYTAADRDNFAYPCYIAGGNASIPYALLTYNSATLTSANNYTLNATGAGNAIRRCVFGAPVAAPGPDVDHPTNSRFASLGNAGQAAAPGLMKLAMDPKWIGVTLYFKFLPVNTFGNTTQQLSAITAYAYTPTGTPGSLQTPGPNSYTQSPVIALTQPTGTSIAMAALTETFSSGAVNYNARTFTITNPSVPTVYYVTIADPGHTGDMGALTNLTATCQTSNALVGVPGNSYIGFIIAVPGGGSGATPAPGGWPPPASGVITA